MTTVVKGARKVVIKKLEERAPEGEQEGGEQSADDSTAVADSSDADSADVEPDSLTGEAAGDSVEEEVDSLSEDIDEDTTGETRPDTVGTETHEENEEEVDDSLSEQEQTQGADTTEGGAPPLTLVMRAPDEGVVVSAGARVDIAGKVSPARAEVVVNGRRIRVAPGGEFTASLTAPVQEGEYTIDVEADVDGTTKKVSRRYSVEEAEEESETVNQVVLAVSVPANNQTISQPLITVRGKTTPGAAVTAGGMDMRVGSDGSFSGRVPIPDEENEIAVEITASYSGETETVVRTVYYSPQLRLTIHSPMEQQVFNTLSVPVKGEVQPQSGELFVNGKSIPVAANGTFTGFITIPDREGEIELEFDLSASSGTKTEYRRIVYQRAADLYKPILQPGYLPKVSRNQRLIFTVIDRTPSDTITFFREIDGTRESEEGEPNGRFYLELEEGVHTYSVFARDKSGNQSQVLRSDVSFLVSTGWIIRMRNPRGDKVVTVPPAAPGSDFQPHYTIEFSVENLPDDEPELLKEITVTNATTGETLSDNDPFDVDFEFDIALKRNQSNVITIRVRDVNDRIESKQVNIFLR
jgi:hypothetical protein